MPPLPTQQSPGSPWSLAIPIWCQPGSGATLGRSPASSRAPVLRQTSRCSQRYIGSRSRRRASLAGEESCSSDPSALPAYPGWCKELVALREGCFECLLPFLRVVVRTPRLPLLIPPRQWKGRGAPSCALTVLSLAAEWLTERVSSWPSSDGPFLQTN